jgi:hypothetical protein
MIVGRGSGWLATHFGMIAANFASRSPCIRGAPAASRARIGPAVSPAVRKSGDL